VVRFVANAAFWALWLPQGPSPLMGIGRAGFYTHEWVERLLGIGHYVEGYSATRIHPERC
jgi:hypothetical protein